MGRRRPIVREVADRHRFDSLAIRGFRGLADLDISELGEVNFLLGANDVGKTSILEAVRLIADPVEPILSVRVQNSRGYPVRGVEDLASLFLELDFSRKVVIEASIAGCGERRRLVVSAPDMDYSIEVKDGLEFRGRRLRYDLEIRGSLREEPRSYHRELVCRGNRWVIGNESLNEVTIERINTIPMAPSSEYDAERIGRLVINKKDQLMIDYLRHVNPRVTRVSVIGKTAYLDIGLAQMMPLNMFGSGIVRTAMAISECLLHDAKILLIDEIGQGLHHQAISFLLEAILRLSKEQGTQVFATTHSLEVIEGVRRVLYNRNFSEHRATTKCITLQRDKGGLVRAYRYDFEQFDHCLEHGIEIR